MHDFRGHGWKLDIYVDTVFMEGKNNSTIGITPYLMHLVYFGSRTD